ncbi:TIGR01906 family membrane protein [Brevibacterium luteolum]|uniref:TIGR01906 family membrane protein n=1 Tax=Brevibacterium luteolum TaxID=199591 RepID=UPI00223C44BA|nr:TIGR01906 family membrane protein [Brevibacterium luteolum]MCT1829974.1 TIGR01906 family membrane protein [Brevibacterium luteolum]
MATDDPKNTDDLLSRRMSSGSEPESSAESIDGASGSRRHNREAHIGEHVADDQTFALGTDDETSRSPLSEETVEFDPIAHRNRELRDRAFAQSTPDPHATAEHRPIDPDTSTATSATATGTGAAAGATTSGAAVAPTQQIRTRDRHDDDDDVDEPGKRPVNALDIIGGIWIALATPFVLAGLAVRLIASGLFLKFAYFWRPGFPADTYGFTNDDRLHYGSYVVDYLNNFDSSRYLSDVVLPNGVPLFQPEEIAHMEDVKDLVSLLYLVAVIGAIGMLIFGLYMSRANGPGLRHALRFGALLTIIAFLALGALAMLGWDRFFTQFHAMFFDAGTWEFYVDDALIRLFPGQFWVDAGIAAATIVLLISALILALSFIGRRRAERKERSNERRAAKAEKKAERRGELPDPASQASATREAGTASAPEETTRPVTVRPQHPEDPAGTTRS